ncbi:MAG: hypothetical protein VZQ62_00185 [Methanosphaera sp.]|jgi:hypothetical protein|nr:hypothetical protein [Methanosphaera sp.]
MNEFLTWEVLLTFTGLVTTTYMVTEFTKEIPLIKKMPTKYWSYIIALVLLFAVNLVTGSFKYEDIVLYLLNAIPVSLSANGLNNFNNGKKKEEAGVQIEEGIGDDSEIIEEDV